MPVRTTRRRFLGGCLGMAALWLLGCGGGDDGEEDIVREALRASARRPGPAIDTLAALTPPARRPAKPLPFGLDDVPGFSADTHRIHWEHHYLEYLYRWERGERDLLVEAAELARTPPEAFDAARWRLLEKAERTRQAANMIVLHELYFALFWSGTERAIPQPAFDRFVRGLGDDWPAWLLAFEDGTVLRWREEDSASFGPAPLAGIDTPDHTWRLDFASQADALHQVLRNMPAAQGDLFLEGRLIGPFDPEPPTDLTLASGDDWQAAVDDLRAAVGLEPDNDSARGLALAAGPDGQVALLVRRGTAFVTPALLLPRLHWGIWEHSPVAVVRGMAATT